MFESTGWHRYFTKGAPIHLDLKRVDRKNGKWHMKYGCPSAQTSQMTGHYAFKFIHEYYSYLYGQSSNWAIPLKYLMFLMEVIVEMKEMKACDNTH